MLSVYYQLALAAAFPIVASVLLYLAETKTAFQNLRYWLRQAIIGIIFGGIAVLGTEFGVDSGGATMNVRDAAPLCAGLIFGAPAGVIAGVIGGVERWFATLWGAGAYTRLACSISTALAGVFGAILRKYMFDDKKPAWFYGLAIAIVMEVIHMLMIFLTNMNDVHRAFTFVSSCTLPMVSMNGLSVMLATLLVSLIGRKRGERRGHKKISQTFQRWLLVCVVIAFLVTSAFTFGMQTRLSEGDTESLLTLNLADVRADISDASDENLLALTRTVAKRIGEHAAADNEYLMLLAGEYDVTEIDVIGPDGMISASTNADFVGFDMASGAQSAEFLVLLSGADEYVQSYQPISYDQAVSRKYAGVALVGGGFVQVGYDAERFQKDIGERVAGATHNRHVGQDGCIIISDENGRIVSDRYDYEGEHLSKTGVLLDRAAMPEGEYFESDVYGEPCVCMYCVTEGYIIVAALPRSEAFFSRDVAVYVMGFMEIIVFATMFALIYFLIKKLVVENIQRINGSLAEITGGNLDVTVDVRANAEFASLSDDINSTVDTLKRYIAEAAARIDQELEFARTIQHSALPAVFPPYPHHTEFDIYAAMDTAKEVGGDFYDFYLLGEEELAFLVADVSGKGIPAAMFMMTAKTLIKSFAEAGCDAAEVFTRANEKLCESNDAGMFVTAWMGVLNLKTGLVTFANAGHNPPLVRRGNDAAEYLQSKPGFVLGGMEGVRYRTQELQLHPGDLLYLYTDGVTEATDAQEALYGEERLLHVLQSHPEASGEALCALVKEDVDAFAGEAPQFDDITMLALQYHGAQSRLSERTARPSLADLSEMTAFVERTLAARGVPAHLIAKMNIAADELYSNIARYSGANSVTLACGVENGFALLRLVDDGTPYDPTLQTPPDVTLPAEKRDIGGLGVHMVKKTMDEMTYAYENGRNILQIKKRL